ncbi:hypothetical protein [Paenibacillus sp. P46E]|uniref:hypothetical protein n=1 Tax=Paenibacillus sp. P46E TaxID=1349436 RepID=UPI00093CF7F4|nr:hypothetical protein [Paenibacillus sp. P46E]OKP93503.1 hypothetical protein A3849_30455 [Paenibacillus sp. P46E]
MNIYGCDFSGAKNPEGKIFIARGQLAGHTLTIERVTGCEDRLDLAHYIKESKAPWGMDFPFSIPEYYLQNQYDSSWRNFVAGAYEDSREVFRDRFGVIHSGKNNRDLRFTDIALQAKSPVSSTPIAMHGMLFGGRKLLHHLQHDVCVYPFDPLQKTLSRLYEVYPSHGWKSLGLKSSEPGAFQELQAVFKANVDVGFDVTVSREAMQGALTAGTKPNLHAMDAVMACIEMGYCLWKYNLEEDWEQRPAFAAGKEWEQRSLEGLAVRLR